jgi:hypothetical protein
MNVEGGKYTSEGKGFKVMDELMWSKASSSS